MNYVGALNTGVKEIATVVAIVVALASADNTAAKVTGLASTVLAKFSALTKLDAGIAWVKGAFSEDNKKWVGDKFESLKENASLRAVFLVATATVAYTLARNSDVVGLAQRYISQAANFVARKI